MPELWSRDRDGSDNSGHRMLLLSEPGGIIGKSFRRVSAPGDHSLCDRPEKSGGDLFKEYEKEGYKYKAIPKYGTQYEINGKKITVLGNGRSVNLFDSEAIPKRSNDIFKASQLVVTDKIINGKDDLRNQVELDIVDKWIDESNILEEYYNLYFKRK